MLSSYRIFEPTRKMAGQIQTEKSKELLDLTGSFGGGMIPRMSEGHMRNDVYLKHFQKNQIIISKNDARSVLIFFFGNKVPPAEQITDDDVAFAQALLLEAIDKSYAMGYVNAIFDVFYMKVPTPDSFKDMIKEFAKNAAKNWFDHATGKDVSDPKIYNNVRLMINSNFGSVWQIRMGGGGLTF
jgi:hypothetical protein